MIGDEIKFHRIAKRYSREELASVLGVSRQCLTNWERGVSIPNIEEVAQIAKVFQMSLDDLVKNKVCPENGPREHEFWGTVRVKNGGEIKIPRKMLDHLDIRWGDELLIVTDVERGIELLPKNILWEKNLEKNFRGERLFEY